MKRSLPYLVRIAAIVVLLLSGFAVGFPVGQQRGFTNGSEWAILQADIAAREAGVDMPVSIEDGRIHVVVKQPLGLHRRAQQHASRSYDRAHVIQARRSSIPVDLYFED